MKFVHSSYNLDSRRILLVTPVPKAEQVVGKVGVPPHQQPGPAAGGVHEAHGAALAVRNVYPRGASREPAGLRPRHRVAPRAILVALVPVEPSPRNITSCNITSCNITSYLSTHHLVTSPHVLTHPPTQSLTHPITHSLTHSLTRLINLPVAFLQSSYVLFVFCLRHIYVRRVREGPLGCAHDTSVSRSRYT
eukprot:244342-Prorocentrum_minimum.AAC.1